MAHPARMTALDVLYEQDQPRTATELAELTGVSASAMSYHLRCLEKHGIVRRSDASADGRERPWERTAHELSVTLRNEHSLKAGVAATDALLSSIMESDRVALVAAQERRLLHDTSVPLDRVARFARSRIVITPAEARALYKQIAELVDQYRPEHRTSTPKGAGSVTVTVLGVADEADTSPGSVRTSRGS